MRRINRALSLILVIVIIVSVSSLSAFARASEYINLTTATISSPSKGKVTVDFSVIGTGYMNRIGVQKIEIYKSNDEKADTIYSTDAGYSHLMISNDYKHEGAASCSVPTGYRYYAIVYFYASDSKGSDVIEHETNLVRA